MTTKLAAQGPKFLMLVAAAVAMVLVVDPLGMSPLVGAVLADSSGDGNLSRSERVDAVVAGLQLDPAVAATNLTGSWGALPGSGSLTAPAVALPTEDEQIVVLSNGSGIGPVSYLSRSQGSQAPAPVDLGGMSVTVAPAAAESTPDAVKLHVADQTETEAAGVTGVLLDVTDASQNAVANPEVKLTVSYADFAGLGGAGWASRLRIMWIPDCTAETLNCSPVPLETTNDTAAQTVTATVPVVAGAGVAPAALNVKKLGGAVAADSTGGASGGSLAVTAGASGSGGNWGATSLAQSATWGAGGSTGAFTWSLPFSAPAVAAGPAPKIGLSYSSAASDGRTPDTNNQSGLVGEGFDLTSGYVERSYVPCSQDKAGGANNANRVSGDLCWGTENATLMFNGAAVELVHDVATDTWHGKHEDGSLIEKLSGAWNGGQANEYWKVTGTDGTQYFFGRGQRSSTDTTALNSAWTVPVYGNHAGEPCHSAAFSDSRCNQVWRWNLEYVVDPSGNSMTYFYNKEFNNYVYDIQGNHDRHIVSYTSGGRLDRIEYGTRAGNETSTVAPAKVTFTTSPRCITDLANPNSWCSSAQTATDSNKWLDSPVDLVCSAEPCTNYSPVFFDRYRLNDVSTFGYDGSAYRPVDSWSIQQRFVASGTSGLENAASPMLVTTGVTHTGKGGTSTTADDLTLPPHQFGYGYLDNRVDSTADGVDPLRRPRITDIRTESGASVTVNYRTECSASDKPGTSDAAQQSNTKLCFPVKWNQSDYADPVVEYFHKYVVDTIVEAGAPPSGGNELITGSVATQTSYTYSGGAGWAKPTGAMVKPAEVTYSDFRGFGEVTTTSGIGADAVSSRATYYRGLGSTLMAGPSGHTEDAIDRLDYEGQVFDSIELNGSAVLSETISLPGEPIVTSTDAVGTTASRIPSVNTYNYSYKANGSLEYRTGSTTLFDANSQVVSVENLGDRDVATDNVCQTTTYAHSTNSVLASKHLFAQISRTDSFSGHCSDTPTYPADLIASTKTTYDDFGRSLESSRIDPTTGDHFVVTSQVLAYDPWGRPLSIADAVGDVSTISYLASAGGLPLSTLSTTPDPDGPGPLVGFTSIKTVDPFTGLLVSTTDANGYLTSGTYDALGRVLTVRYPQDQNSALPSLQYEYTMRPNGLNAVVTKTLAADAVSQHVSVSLYDGLLRPFQTQVEGADAGADHNATAAERGRMVSQTYYDSLGRVSKQTGQWWASGAPQDTPVVAEPVPPSQTTYEFDAAGRTTAQVFWVGTTSAALNEKWRTVTNYDGSTTLQIPPLGGTPKATTVDALGRTVKVTEYIRDADTEASVDTAAEVRADLAQQSTTFRYDAAGQRTAMFDPEGNQWSYDYDFAGRQTASTDPDAGSSTTSYDALNRVATHTDGNGKTLTYTYDHIGRTTELHEGATLRVKWTYDEATDPAGHHVLGQLSSSSRFVDGQEYKTSVLSYDFAGHPLATKVTLPNIPAFAAVGPASGEKSFTTGYSYMADGQVASITLPAVKSGNQTRLGRETVTTRYDTASMPSWMSGGFGWGTYVAESRFTPDGRPLVTDLGNTYGAIASYRYEDGTNRLIGVALDREGFDGTAVDIHYGYDAAGNVTSMSDRPTNLSGGSSQDNQCYGYDGLDRLTVAWTAGNANCSVAQGAIQTSDVGGAAPYWSEYEYDPLGNRTKLTEHGLGGAATSTTLYEHGGIGVGPHQVTKTTKTVAGTGTATQFAYDDAGNRVSAAGSTYQWGAEGELDAVDGANYIYDASGSRLVRSDASGTTVFLPGGQEVTVNGSTVTATRYYSFDGMTVATRTGSGLGAVSSLVCNGQGTVVAAVPNTTWTATSVKRVFTDPFGAIRGSSDAAVPGDHRFLGAVRDSGTNLTLLGARYYDPAVGQFVSVDPLLDAGVPAQFNGYSYAFNNPVTFSDPSGMTPHGSKSKGSVSKKAGKPAPPPTSWEALGKCKDFWCGASWWSSASNQVTIGGLEEVGQLLWSICSICQVSQQTAEFVNDFSDWNGYVARQQAQSKAEQALLAGGPDAWWHALTDPLVHDWDNNPGNVVGHAYVDVATLAIPVGGAALKGLRVAKAAEEGLAGATAAEDAAAAATSGLSGDLAALADANVTNSGKTVIGSYPGYISSAEARGASYFNIGDEWDALVARGQDPWALNQHFLDGRIAAADTVYSTVPRGSIDPGSYLARETQYLQNNGYRWVNQWALKPSG